MWKVLFFIILIVLIVFVLIHFGIIKIGFGFGKGSGSGNGDSVAAASVEPEKKEEVVQKEPEPLRIVVAKTVYFIDDKEVKIADIKSRVDGFSGKIIVESNYASLKEWEELIKVLKEMNASYEEIK